MSVPGTRVTFLPEEGARIVAAWQQHRATHPEINSGHETSPFICGAAVVLHGLTAAALNGTRGRLLSKADTLTTRCSVRFQPAVAAGAPPPPLREARIKVENLTIVPFTEKEANLNSANERLLAEKIFHRRSVADIVAILRRPTSPNATMPLTHGFVLYPRTGYTNREEVGIQGCEPGSSALNLAAQFGGAAIISALLDAGADWQWRVDTLQGVNCGAIHIAARCGRVNAVRALLDGGSHTELRDAGALTPLYHAVMYKRTACVALLLARGAEAEAIACTTRREGGPAAALCCIQIALGNGDKECVSLLLDATEVGDIVAEMAACLDATDLATVPFPPALIAKIRAGLYIAPGVHWLADADSARTRADEDEDGNVTTYNMDFILPLIGEAEKMLDLAEAFLGRKKEGRDDAKRGMDTTPPIFFS